MGIFELSENTGLSAQQIRTALKKLKSTNEITIKSTNKFSIITIVNYESYQQNNKQVNNQDNKQITNNQQTNNKQITTTKELKNDKELKELKNKEDIYTSFYKNLETLNQKAEFVYMSDEQVNKLISKYSEPYVNLAIEKLNIWKLEKHEKKQYKDCYGSDYLKILKWVMMAVIEDQKKLDYGASQKVISNMQKAKDPELTRKCEEMVGGGYMTWEHAQKFSKEQIDACYLDYKKRLEIGEV